MTDWSKDFITRGPMAGRASVGVFAAPPVFIGSDRGRQMRQSRERGDEDAELTRAPNCPDREREDYPTYRSLPCPENAPLMHVLLCDQRQRALRQLFSHVKLIADSFGLHGSCERSDAIALRSRGIVCTAGQIVGRSFAEGWSLAGTRIDVHRLFPRDEQIAVVSYGLDLTRLAAGFEMALDVALDQAGKMAAVVSTGDRRGKLYVVNCAYASRAIEAVPSFVNKLFRNGYLGTRRAIAADGASIRQMDGLLKRAGVHHKHRLEKLADAHERSHVGADRPHDPKTSANSGTPWRS